MPFFSPLSTSSHTAETRTGVVVPQGHGSHHQFFPYSHFLQGVFTFFFFSFFEESSVTSFASLLTRIFPIPIVTMSPVISSI